MNELKEILLVTWMGVPLVIWILGIVVLGCLAFRARNFRFVYKGRDRMLTLETNNPVARNEQGKKDRKRDDSKPK